MLQYLFKIPKGDSFFKTPLRRILLSSARFKLHGYVHIGQLTNLKKCVCFGCAVKHEIEALLKCFKNEKHQGATKER
jgi:hypothetical protein